jgi:uncharacterized cupredoxin-like copper-binding protein
MKKIFALFDFLISLSLVLVACGSSGPSTNLRVDMTDFMYNPADTIVPAGETVTLELVNNGAVEHEFAIMDFGTEVGDDFGDEEEVNIYWEAELGPGEVETFTFTAPSKPGEYQIVCGIKGHYTAGMVGSMMVVAE